MGLLYYSRMRLTQQLLPLLQNATSVCHVVSVADGACEGKLFLDDIPLHQLTLPKFEAQPDTSSLGLMDIYMVLKVVGHASTVLTLGLEALAQRAPNVSFVHTHPGTVATPTIDRLGGVVGVVLRIVTYLFGRWICVPIEESGQRHLFFATSDRYKASGDTGTDGVALHQDVDEAVDIYGTRGGGVYSIIWDGECADEKIQQMLRTYEMREWWRKYGGGHKTISGRSVKLVQRCKINGSLVENIIVYI